MKLSRNSVSRVADEARALISRLRALAGIHDPFGSDVLASQPEDSTFGIPRRGDGTWEPELTRDISVTLTTRLIDEEGDETDLPLEFATATMGHILLGQSQPDAARQMFLAVHARSPDDAEARRGLELTGGVPDSRPSPKKSHRPSQRPPLGLTLAAARAPEPWEMLDRSPAPESYGVVEARCLAVDPGAVVVFWELTSIARAEASRGLRDASPALCVVSLLVGPHGVERSERWIENIPLVGDWFVTGLPHGATHLCSIGVRSPDGFVPVVHAEPVIAPRGKASHTAASVRATLVVPSPTDRTRPRIVTLSGPADALAVASALLLAPAARLIVSSHPSGSAELVALMDRLAGATTDSSPGGSEG